MVEIIKEMPYADYHAAPGLSHSAMKDLIVSPFRFWYLHLNPDRPQRDESEFMVFGRALHHAVLEPDTFDDNFACEFIAPDGCLDKADEIKQWIKDNGGTPRGTVKSAPGGWIDQALAIDPDIPILERLKEKYDAENAHRTILKIDDWYRLAGCAEALRREPEFQRLTEKGDAEVSYFVTDPDTGVRLKARMDFVAKDWTLDPKTFSQMRGKSIDRSVADAFYYEGYSRQAFLYTHIRHIAGEGIPAFINPFVESEEPHEVRIKQANRKALYWIDDARPKTLGLIRLYAQLTKEFGDKPWRRDAAVNEMQDEEIPAIAWGGN